MVTTTDTTTIVTAPRHVAADRGSFKRWLKHFCFMPATKRYFSVPDQHAIAQAVTHAERGHVGEIQVVIEGHLPCSQAYSQTVRMRARELFAELGVWDTEFNSGTLLYLNLCEQQVEIVIDRGLEKATEQAVWDGICLQLTAQMQQQNYREAVVEAVMAIGQVLDAFYGQNHPDQANELSNRPILLD